jgi:hypothetical protein
MVGAQAAEVFLLGGTTDVSPPEPAFGTPICSQDPEKWVKQTLCFIYTFPRNHG